MPRYDLAGNPLPEFAAPSPDSTVLPTHQAAPTAPAVFVYAPAPPPSAVAAPAPHVLLTRKTGQEAPEQRVRAYAGLVGVLLLLIVLTYAVAALPPPHIPAPTSYTPYTSQATGLTCAAPDGWKRQEDVGAVSFTRGKARIEIGGLPPDVVSASRTVADLHTRTQELLAKALTDDHFQEQTAQPLATGMGGGLISPWSAEAGLTHLRGYRATLMAGDNTTEVICVCPQRDWATLQPAFVHIIQSLTATQSGGQQP